MITGYFTSEPVDHGLRAHGGQEAEWCQLKNSAPGVRLTSAQMAFPQLASMGPWPSLTL